MVVLVFKCVIVFVIIVSKCLFLLKLEIETIIVHSNLVCV